MKRQPSLLRNERGGILPLAAVSLTAMLAIAAFAIDCGQMYMAKQRAQNVADAAAHAGAWELALNSDRTVGKDHAVTAANESATSNNGVATSWQVQKPSDAAYGVDVAFPVGTIHDDAGNPITVSDGQAVRATGYIKVNFAFAGVFGLISENINASATCIIAPEGTVTGNLMAPLVVSDKTIFGNGSTYLPTQFGDQVTLKVTNWQNDFIGAGNFGAVALPGMGPGGSGYRDALAGNDTTPFVLTIDPPTYIDTKTGNMQGPTQQGVAERLGDETDPRFTNDATAWTNWLASYDPSTEMFAYTSRIVMVPIAEDPGTPTNGSTQAKIIGMAGFFIESYTKNDCIVGRFLQGVQAGDTIRWIFPTDANSTPTTAQNILFIKPIS